MESWLNRSISLEQETVSWRLDKGLQWATLKISAYSLQKITKTEKKKIMSWIKGFTWYEFSNTLL